MSQSVNLSSGLPETVLPPPDPAAAAMLATANEITDRGERRDAMAEVAAAFPRCLEAWAALCEVASDPVESYAYARVGYHRGLDALRAAGWRGSGYCRWEHESNRGFLRSLEGLRRAAAAIAEDDEQERCNDFLHQLDPDWDRRAAS